MRHYVNPMMAEAFTKDDEFDSTDCSNFEVVNEGETIIFLNEIVELKPGNKEFFPSQGHCMAYQGPVSIKFIDVPGKPNKAIVKASRYV